MKKRLILEIVLVTLFVVVATFVIYSKLAGIPLFWSSQFFWSLGLIVCWMIVSAGYFNQGSIIHRSQSSANVSHFLPMAVFTVQCILFVKGIYYHDWSLIGGAVIVNSGVLFTLYQIWKYRNK